MIFVAIVFGLGYLPTSLALATNGVFGVLFWRFLLAAIIAGAIFYKKLKDVTPKDFKGDDKKLNDYLNSGDLL